MPGGADAAGAPADGDPVLSASLHTGKVRRLPDARGVTPGSLEVIVGAWRSLVARLHGAQEVVGSNPAAPTIFTDSSAIVVTGEYDFG